MVLWLGFTILYAFLFLIVFLSFPKVNFAINFGYLTLMFVLAFVLLFWLDFRKESRRYRFLARYLLEHQLLFADALSLDVEDSYLELIRSLYQKQQTHLTLLEERSSEYRDFITGWVHDAKVPLAVLNMVLESDSSIDSKVKQDMEEELLRLFQYLEKILYFIRLDDFHNDYIPKQIPLKKVVSSSLKSFSKLFSYQKIELELGSLEEVVLTDEAWLSFIINQLLSNALKYTGPEGKITITSGSDLSETYLEVYNTGEGIKKSDLPRLFKRGFTGYTGHQQYKATGYGLYLSNLLAEKLGHRMEVKSEFQKSASFRIYFKKMEDYRLK